MIGSSFAFPQGVAVDLAGDVYVADTFNNAVKEVLPDGTIKTIGSGFTGPNGVAIDQAGDLFVADTHNNRVVELSVPTVVATPLTLSGSTATAVSGAINGLAAGTTYYFRTVATNAAGTVVASSPQSFTTLTLPTVSITPVSAISATGATLNGSVDPNGSAATVSFQYSTDSTFTPTNSSNLTKVLLSAPAAVAANGSGDLFVISGYSSVYELFPDNSTMQIGSGFNNPLGVAVDNAGDVFVADTGNNSVKEVLAGGTIKTIGSGFSNPSGVAVDLAGDVFVADTGNFAFKEVLPNGTIKTLGIASSSYPYSIAVDAAGDLFACDGSSIIEFLTNGTKKTIASGFPGIKGISVDSFGDVFAAEYNNTSVLEVLPSGIVRNINAGNLLGPSGTAVNAAGILYVVDLVPFVFVVSPPTAAALPSAVSGSAATSIAATLTDLTPGTTYYYRAVATSAEGIATSVTGSFTTPNLASITSPSATTVTATAATLGGNVTSGAVRRLSSAGWFTLRLPSTRDPPSAARA